MFRDANLRTLPVGGIEPLVVALLAVVSLIGCSSPKPATPATTAAKRYPLSGTVVAIDKGQNQVTVDAGDIPGFMSAMTMPYSVKDPQSLDSLTPGDQVTADVLVNGNDVNLDNLVVVKKAEQPPASSPAPSESQPPASAPSDLRTAPGKAPVL